MTRRQRGPLRALTEKERIARQANCGRCGSKTECVYGFKVALMRNPEGVTTSLRLASAN